MNILRRVLLSLLLTAGCTASPPAKPPSTVQVSLAPAGTALTAEPSPPAPAVIAVSAVRPPPDASIDGDPGEWGSLGGREGPADPRRSNLVFALDQRALLIAASLGEGAREGIWLGLAATPPMVIPIGTGWTNGGTDPINCDLEGHLVGPRWVTGEDGKPASPESKAACKAVLDHYEKFVSSYEKRFSRRFKIDREGVREVTANGELLSIAGASAVWKPGAAGISVEASLPLSALPRLVEAPLTSIGAWARVTPAAPPEVPAEQVKVPLPHPVSFGPYPEILAHVLEENKYQTKWDIQYPTAAQSYQPGDPLRVESIDYDGPSAVKLNEGTLYERALGLGDIEVGYVHAFHEYVAIFKGGKLLSLVKPQPNSWPTSAHEDPSRGCDVMAKWQGLVARDGIIHVILSYTGGGATLACGMAGSHAGGWTALAIASDGTHHEAPREGGGPSDAYCHSGTESANGAFDTFTWRGDCLLRGKSGGPEQKTGIDVTTRWDGAKHKYITTWRRVPLEKKK